MATNQASKMLKRGVKNVTTHKTIIFMSVVEKKFAQKIGRSNSYFGNTAKSKTCKK